MTALRLLPPLCWTALIAWLSTSGWSADRTSAALAPWLRALLPWALPEQIEAMHWLLRKGGHFLEYAVLAALWRRVFPSRGWRRPLALSVLTAALDELHQALIPEREGSAWDVLLDAAAAGITLGVLAAGPGRAADIATGALLWFSAVAATAVLLLNLAAGAPSGWLWLSAPVAWAALWLWRRRRAGA